MGRRRRLSRWRHDFHLRRGRPRRLCPHQHPDARPPQLRRHRRARVQGAHQQEEQLLAHDRGGRNLQHEPHLESPRPVLPGLRHHSRVADLPVLLPRLRVVHHLQPRPRKVAGHLHRRPQGIPGEALHRTSPVAPPHRLYGHQLHRQLEGCPRGRPLPRHREGLQRGVGDVGGIHRRGPR